MSGKWDSPWVGERVEQKATGNVDELLDSLGLADDPIGGGQASAAAPASGGGRSPLWIVLAAVSGLALVAVVGVLIWQSGADPESTDAALGTVTAEADEVAEPVVELDDEADRLRGVLAGLGFDRVDVEIRDDQLVVVGSVPTEQDVSAVRNAVIASSDPTLVNLTELMVDGPPGPPAGGAQGAPAPAPGAQRPDRPPPPGFVPPTPEMQDNLQSELDRVLTDTPLVFSPGSVELNEVQLKLLDTTIIGLLMAHPGVPVRLVGYTDDTGDEYQNTLLSFARAEAVQAYLIASGVPEFILRVEGRGEENQSGDAGADRRVEIEVIRTP